MTPATMPNCPICVAAKPMAPSFRPSTSHQEAYWAFAPMTQQDDAGRGQRRQNQGGGLLGRRRYPRPFVNVLPPSAPSPPSRTPDLAGSSSSAPSRSRKLPENAGSSGYAPFARRFREGSVFWRDPNLGFSQDQLRSSDRRGLFPAAEGRRTRRHCTFGRSRARIMAQDGEDPLETGNAPGMMTLSPSCVT